MVLNKASVERGFAHGSVYRGRVSSDARYVNLSTLLSLLYLLLASQILLLRPTNNSILHNSVSWPEVVKCSVCPLS